MLNLNTQRVKNILLKYIFNKNDFEKLTDCVTSFINTKNDFKGMEKYLKLIENEHLIPISNENFSLGILKETNGSKVFKFSNDETILNKANLWFNGTLPDKKETMIENYNFFVYYGIADKKCYKNLQNISDEIERILEDIDNDSKDLTIFFLKNILEIEITNILELNNEQKNLLKNFLYVEFLNINNDRAEMFKHNHAPLYSALLNYSYEDIKRSNLYDPENYENWNEISVLLRKFLKEISARTIHY